MATTIPTCPHCKKELDEVEIIQQYKGTQWTTLQWTGDDWKGNGDSEGDSPDEVIGEHVQCPYCNEELDDLISDWDSAEFIKES